MIRICELSLPLGATEGELRRKAAKLLRLRPEEIKRLELVRESIDARRRGPLHLVCSVNVEVEDEEKVLARVRSRGVRALTRTRYEFPAVQRRGGPMPVVVGMGPAGLFAALFLARAGIPSVVLERGARVEERTEKVERFWQRGILDPETNVLFGEGGAGTFSDGKLTTGTHDPRIQAVLDTLVAAGAPEDVAYSFRPHVGTDVLRRVVRALREELIALGCDVRFGNRLVGLEASNGRLTGVRVASERGRTSLETDALILAPGHSARDTFSMLLRAGVPMEQKPFAIGVRIEHHQEAISRAQYGDAWDRLPPSDYKLSCHLSGGRSVFSFCVCPGGQVIAAASEEGRLVTNGMSLRARDGVNINGGLLVGVTPADFGSAAPLAGVDFQRRWEEAAFRAGGGGFIAPAQRVGDLLAGRKSVCVGTIAPSYRPGVRWTALDGCLPEDVLQALREALPLLDRKVRGFAHPDAVLTGVETRSSSPVRIPRDAQGQSALRGVFPCGEGCGYAGGIVSAAVDGIRAAEWVAACENG